MATSREKNITIKDVARAAGVSITTVSNVLNSRLDAMSDETLQRIIKVMHELNYHPNALARGLVTHHTATIGVIVAEIETPLFVHALNTIEPIARDAGYSVLMSNARDSEEEYQMLQVLLEKRVDGLIFLSVSQEFDNDYVLELERLQVPTVLVNRAITDEGLDLINWDDTNGVIGAVEYLIQLGHERIAHLHGPKGRLSGKNRLQGYKAALKKHGLAVKPDYVRAGDYTAAPDRWRQSTLELLALSPRPTAIVASDDIVAAIAIKTAQQAGLHVPRDISIVGIDDQHFCSYLNPALTTVRLPVLEAGQRAVEMVLERIAGRCVEAEHVILPCSLIVRDSCAAPPGP
jgi:LacI family transcriptional regulator